MIYYHYHSIVVSLLLCFRITKNNHIDAFTTTTSSSSKLIPQRPIQTSTTSNLLLLYLQNNNDDNDSTEQEQPQDLNSAFMSYMAQQQQEKGLNNNSNSYNLGGSSTNNNIDDFNSSNNDGNLRKRISSSLPGIRRLWGGAAGGANSNESDSDQVVQHIPISSNTMNSNTEDSKINPMQNQQQQQQQDEYNVSSQKNTYSSSFNLPNPPPLLQQDINRINDNYQKFQSQMEDQLNELRNQNPESVPDNADEILSQVIAEQKAYDMKEATNQRALKSFDEYYARRMKEQISKIENDDYNNNQVDVTNSVNNEDPLVKEILDEAAKEQEIRIVQEEQYRQYQEYEESLRKMCNPNINANDKIMNTNKNFDEMQLEILQDLLQKRQELSAQSGIDDEDLFLTDNIEEGIEELQDLVDNGSILKDKYKPETLKEWQMYRAIATKLANSKRKDDDEVDDIDNDTMGSELLSQDDDDIARRKVEEWKEFQKKEEEMRKQAGLSIKYKLPFEWSDKPEPERESLLQSKPKKSFDFEKAEKARSELDELALQVLNDLMIKTTDPMRQEKIRKEIEILKDGIQARLEAIKNTSPEVTRPKAAPIDINAALGRGKKSSSTTDDNVKSKQSEDDNFLNVEEDYDDEYFVDVEDIEDEEEPPDSEFFKDIEEDIETNRVDAPIEPVSSNEEMISINLGSMEEQKFRSMVARSGVRTVEGQNKLKQDWEDFQRAEKMMRDKIGLSGSTAGGEPNLAVKYDVNTIFKDGDIDADLILGTIGKRPSRKDPKTKKDEIITNKQEFSSIDGSSQNIDGNPIEDEPVELKPSESIEVSSENPYDTSLDNPEPIALAPLKEDSTPNGSSTFELGPQYLSNSLSSFDARKADLLQYSVLSVTQLNTFMGLKQSVHLTGVSPYLSRVTKPFQDFGAIFLLEGALVDITGLCYEAWKRTARDYNLEAPDLEDVKFASVYSAEYSIQKVFFWTDDILTIKKITETFTERKREVFDEWKERKDSTTTKNGSEPINVASSDGVILNVDILNVQMKIWEKIARENGFEAPSKELVSSIGSVSPDEAIRDIFRWTNDFVLSYAIGTSYQNYLKEESSNIMRQSNTQPTTLNTNKAPTMEDYLQLKQKAWESVAEQRNLTPPSFDQVNVAEFAGPEKAVKDIFSWITNDEDSTSIIQSYRAILKDLTQQWLQTIGNQSFQSMNSKSDEDVDAIPLVVLREGADHWLSSIADVYVPAAVVSWLDEDLMNKVIEEAGITSFFPDDKKVSSSSQYKSLSQQLLGASLRVERRPDHCVVFSATPQSASIAHDVEMKNIAMVSPYPYYELTTADMTVRDYRSIGMMNLKNVFSETGAEEPMQQIQVESPRVQRRTLLKTRFKDD